MKDYTPKDWLKSNLVTNKKLKELENKIDSFEVTVDSELDSTSENPVQNKVIADALDNIEDSIDDIEESIGDIEEEMNNFSETATFNFTVTIDESTGEMQITPVGFNVDDVVDASETKEVKAAIDVSAIYGADSTLNADLSTVLVDYTEQASGITIDYVVVFGGTGVNLDGDFLVQPTCLFGMKAYLPPDIDEPTYIWQVKTDLYLGTIPETIEQLRDGLLDNSEQAAFIAGEYVVTYNSNAGTCSVSVDDTLPNRMYQFVHDSMLTYRAHNNMIRIRVNDTYTSKAYLIYNMVIEPLILPDDGWEITCTFELPMTSIRFSMHHSSTMVAPTIVMLS